MIEDTYENKVFNWKKFREKLETHEQPLEAVQEYYKFAPRVNIQVDPWSKETWPDPWELLEENQYCDFSIILGIYYTLKLTERFKDSNFEIHIINDSELGYQYILYIDDKVIGLEDLGYSSVEDYRRINNLRIQQRYYLSEDY